MTWPFENDTSDIEKKLAKRSLHRERQRNLFAIIALVLTAFMITATFSIGFSYFETYQMQQIRLMGTTADVGITNVTENQLVEISKSNLVLDNSVTAMIRFQGNDNADKNCERLRREIDFTEPAQRAAPEIVAK